MFFDTYDYVASADVVKVICESADAVVGSYIRDYTNGKVY